jgi:hypothetical protein
MLLVVGPVQQFDLPQYQFIVGYRHDTDLNTRTTVSAAPEKEQARLGVQGSLGRGAEQSGQILVGTEAGRLQRS